MRARQRTREGSGADNTFTSEQKYFWKLIDIVLMVKGPAAAEPEEA